MTAGLGGIPAELADDPRFQRLLKIKHAQALKRKAKLLHLQQVLSYKRLRHFVRDFWTIASPQTDQLVWFPGLDVICDEIEALMEESDRRRAVIETIYREAETEEEAVERIIAFTQILPPLRLVINVPPRSGKSTVVQKLALAWRWLHRPGEQVLALANNETLIERDGASLRRVVQHPKYRALLAFVWKHKVSSGELKPEQAEPWTLRPEQNAKKRFENTAGGSRAGYPWGADFIGVDADGIFIDDPNDVEDVLNATPDMVAKRMKASVDTYEDKVLDRLNSKVYSYVILIMQRLDIGDLAQHMIDEGAAVVCLPTEYEAAHPNAYTAGTQWNPAAETAPEARYPYVHDGDWRSEDGQLLNPVLLPRAFVERLKKRIRGWLSKHMQKPLKLSQGSMQRSWFSERYTESPLVIAQRAIESGGEVWITSDAATFGKKSNDLHAIQVWARIGQKYYFLDRNSGRMNSPAYFAAMDAMRLKWSSWLTGCLIENTANGAQYLMFRQGEGVGGLHDFHPTRDTPGKDKSKPARAKYVENASSARQVVLPAVDHEDRHLAQQAEEWLVFILSFPAEPDDDMDAASQLIMRFELAARENAATTTLGIAKALSNTLRKTRASPSSHAKAGQSQAAAQAARSPRPSFPSPSLPSSAGGQSTPTPAPGPGTPTGDPAGNVAERAAEAAQPNTSEPVAPKRTGPSSFRFR